MSDFRVSIINGCLFNSYYTEVSGGHNSFPWISPLILDAYIIMMSVKQGRIKCHFLSL